MSKRTEEKTTFIGTYSYRKVVHVNINSYTWEGKERFHIMLGDTLYGSADNMDDARQKATDIINRNMDTVVEDKLTN